MWETEGNSSHQVVGLSHISLGCTFVDRVTQLNKWSMSWEQIKSIFYATSSVRIKHRTCPSLNWANINLDCLSECEICGSVLPVLDYICSYWWLLDPLANSGSLGHSWYSVCIYMTIFTRLPFRHPCYLNCHYKGWSNLKARSFQKIIVFFLL